MHNVSTTQPDAGRRLIWITPDKPQAQSGVEADALPPSELRSSSTRYGIALSVYASLRKPCAFPVRETISIEKICAATGSKPRMGFHMMNLLRRFVDLFRIDSMDMNALTGNVNSVRDDRKRLNHDLHD
ncbi:MAG: hypothetical protein LBL24_03505 [Bacteroidales bacterium]|nr:hypothetical protein [Bacteroidales bacterium]